MSDWFTRLFSTNRRRNRQVPQKAVVALESRQLLAANRAPEIPTGQTFRVDENKNAGTIVGRVQATDPDGQPIHSYRVTGYGFSIDGSGYLRTLWPLNHEVEPRIQLWVSASDGTSWSAPTLVDVIVNNLNEAPYKPISIGNFKGFDGRNDLIVATSITSGTRLAEIAVTDYDANDSVLQISVVGKLAQGVEVRRDPRPGYGHLYSLVVTKPELFKKGATTRWTITFRDSQGLAASQTVDLVVPTGSQSVVTPEGIQKGQQIGTLPSNLRGGRFSYFVLGGARTAAIGKAPISISSGGQILARSFSDVLPAEDQVGYWRSPRESVFDYESMIGPGWTEYPGTRTQPTSNLPGGVGRLNSVVVIPPLNPVTLLDPGHFGEVLIGAIHRSTGKVFYQVVTIDVSNVDELPEIDDQTVFIGRDGTGGLTNYFDPDNRFGHASGLGTQGRQEMRIVAGDDLGIFTVPPGNVLWWGTAMRMKIAKPHLLGNRTEFTLRVQVLENGKVGGEATVRVFVQATVDEIILL